MRMFRDDVLIKLWNFSKHLNEIFTYRIIVFFHDFHDFTLFLISEYNITETVIASIINSTEARNSLFLPLLLMVLIYDKLCFYFV